MTPGGSIQVTYQELEDASSRYQQQLGQLSDLLGQIQNTINGVAGVSWQSAAQQQFSEDVTNWNDSATKIQQAGVQLAQFLKTAASTYQQTDSSLQQSLQQQ